MDSLQEMVHLTLQKWFTSKFKIQKAPHYCWTDFSIRTICKILDHLYKTKTHLDHAIRPVFCSTVDSNRTAAAGLSGPDTGGPKGGPVVLSMDTCDDTPESDLDEIVLCAAVCSILADEDKAL